MNLHEKNPFTKIFKEKRDRQPNWTETEKQYLLMLTKRHRVILETKGSDSPTIKKKSDAWDEIAFNMNAAGFHRTKERLKQQLGRIKSAEAKKAKDALTTEILKSDSKITEPLKVGMNERKTGVIDTNETKSEFQRKNCSTHSDEVIIKMEKAISIDEFEELPTDVEKIQRSTDQLSTVLKNQKVEDEEGETNSLSSSKSQHSKNQMLLHLSSYKMRPSLNESFRAIPIKNIIQRVLTETLQGKTYNAEEASNWTKEIADAVSAGVKELEMPQFKHVVQVTLGQQLGSGCRYIAKCCWDAESDSQTSDVFTNAALFCICTVFGIYLY